MASPFTRYVRGFFAAALVILALFVGFDVLVDPYRIWDLAVVPGVNAIKPAAFKQEEMAKPYAELRVRPLTLLLGNSRPSVAFDPDQLETLGGPSRIYNFGIPGFGIYNVRRLLQHALAGRGVRTVVLTLDFTDFLEPDVFRPPTVPRFDRLLVDPDGAPNRLRWVQEATDFATGFASVDALTDSIHTIVSQDLMAGTVTARGYLHKDFERVIAADGQYLLFLQKNQSSAGNIAHAPRRLAAATDREGSYAELRRIIDLCRANGAPLILVVPPYHADYLEIFREYGRWGQFEDWKRLLATTAAQAGAADPAAPPVTVWDFADYDRWTTEPVPRQGERRVMQWYWESGHYRPELGNLIWKRMFDPAAAGPLADLGAELRLETVEARLSAIRDRQATAMGRVDAELLGMIGPVAQSTQAKDGSQSVSDVP